MATARRQPWHEMDHDHEQLCEELAQNAGAYLPSGCLTVRVVPSY